MQNCFIIMGSAVWKVDMTVWRRLKQLNVPLPEPTMRHHWTKCASHWISLSFMNGRDDDRRLSLMSRIVTRIIWSPPQTQFYDFPFFIRLGQLKMGPLGFISNFYCLLASVTNMRYCLLFRWIILVHPMQSFTDKTHNEDDKLINRNRVRRRRRWW